MRFQRPLDDLFGSPSAVRVLRALYELPEGFPTSARELARRAGISHPTASKALASLADQGIVVRKRARRADSFQLSRLHTATQELEGLFEWEERVTADLIAFLRGPILDEEASIREAFIFGSSAREEMTPTSDVDLAVVCEPGATEKVTAMLEDVGDLVRERYGNRLSFVLGTAPLSELTKPGRRGYRLWKRIEREGIRIANPGKGSDDD